MQTAACRKSSGRSPWDMVWKWGFPISKPYPMIDTSLPPLLRETTRPGFALRDRGAQYDSLILRIRFFAEQKNGELRFGYPGYSTEPGAGYPRREIGGCPLNRGLRFAFREKKTPSENYRRPSMICAGPAAKSPSSGIYTLWFGIIRCKYPRFLDRTAYLYAC
jgi:hypothetical protein